MPDIMSEAHKVESYISHAQHGDNGAATALSAELARMSASERNTIGLIVGADFTIKHGLLQGGGRIDYDSNGNVTGIDFNVPANSYQDASRPAQPARTGHTLAPITDHSNIPGFANKIRSAYDRLPSNLAAVLRANNYHIDAYNDVADSGLVNRNAKPGNYPKGSTYQNDPAFTYRDHTVLGELASEHGRTTEVVFHEAGHAIDMALGKPSKSQAFVAAYEKDMQGLSDADRQRLAYYLPNSDNHYNENIGRAEMFAQMMNVINHIAGPDAGDDPLIAQKFRNTMAVERSILANARPPR